MSLLPPYDWVLWGEEIILGILIDLLSWAMGFVLWSIILPYTLKLKLTTDLWLFSGSEAFLILYPIAVVS